MVPRGKKHLTLLRVRRSATRISYANTGRKSGSVLVFGRFSSVVIGFSNNITLLALFPQDLENYTLRDESLALGFDLVQTSVS